MSHFGMTSLHSMTGISQRSLSQKLLFLLSPRPKKRSLPGCPCPWWRGARGCRERPICGTASSGWCRAPACCTPGATGSPAPARASAGQAGQGAGNEGNGYTSNTGSALAYSLPHTQQGQQTHLKKETWGFSSHTCSMCMFSRRALWCFRIGKVSSSSSSS